MLHIKFYHCEGQIYIHIYKCTSYTCAAFVNMWSHQINGKQKTIINDLMIINMTMIISWNWTEKRNNVIIK